MLHIGLSASIIFLHLVPFMMHTTECLNCVHCFMTFRHLMMGFFTNWSFCDMNVALHHFSLYEVLPFLVFSLSFFSSLSLLRFLLILHFIFRLSISNFPFVESFDRVTVMQWLTKVREGVISSMVVLALLVSLLCNTCSSTVIEFMVGSFDDAPRRGDDANWWLLHWLSAKFCCYRLNKALVAMAWTLCDQRIMSSYLYGQSVRPVLRRRSVWAGLRWYIAAVGEHHILWVAKTFVRGSRAFPSIDKTFSFLIGSIDRVKFIYNIVRALMHVQI